MGFLQSDNATWDRLFCLYPKAWDHLLRWHVEDREFGASNNWPLGLLAGISDRGERQALGTYYDEDQKISKFVPVTITMDRDGVIIQVDGVHIESSSDLDQFYGLQMYVLRHEPHEAMAAAILADGGVDATGPFYWKRCEPLDGYASEAESFEVS